MYLDLSDLIFTGFNRRVAALHRETGEILWQWTAPSGNSYTSLLLDGDRLIVSVHGYMYALDAKTGQQLWMNEMSGFGYGVASLASVRGGATPATLLAAVAAEDAAPPPNWRRPASESTPELQLVRPVSPCACKLSQPTTCSTHRTD